jgi:hypothetical protein
MQPAITHSPRNRLAAQTGREQLYEPQEPVLPRGDPGKGDVDLSRYMGRC